MSSYAIESRPNGTARMVYSTHGSRAGVALGKHAMGVDHALTLREALVLGGADWTVSERPVSVEGSPAPRYKGLVRSEDGKVLSIEGATYGVVPHATVLERVLNGSPIRALGVSDHGRLVWAQSTFATTAVGKAGAPVEHSLFAAAPYGGGCVRAGLSSTAIGCQNTLAANATGAALTEALAVRHTSGAAGHFEARARLLEQSKAAVALRDAQFNAMCELAMSDAEARAAVERLYGKRNPEDGTVTLTPRGDRVLAAYLGETWTGAAETDSSERHSAWGLYQAVTEDVDTNRLGEADRWTRAVFSPDSAERRETAFALLAGVTS